VQDFPSPRTPEPEYPLPVPTTSDYLFKVPPHSLEAYRRERQRQIRIEQGISRGVSLEEAPVQLQILELGVDSTSLDLFIPPASEGRTPQQQFCIIDMTQDPNPIYGRMQWTDCENPELSVYQRQLHAEQLALRFLQYSACPQSQQFMSTETGGQGVQSLKLPVLHHPYEILSESSETEQCEMPHGVAWEHEGRNGERTRQRRKRVHSCPARFFCI